MILNEKEVTERMNSPLNLLNRLRSVSSNSIDKNGSPIKSIPNPINPFAKPIKPDTNPIINSSDIIPDLDEKLEASSNSIKNKASKILIQAMDELKSRVTETVKPEVLAKIAAEMNKIITTENDANRGNDNRPQFVLYAPQFNQENNYETIYSRE